MGRGVKQGEAGEWCVGGRRSSGAAGHRFVQLSRRAVDQSVPAQQHIGISAAAFTGWLQPRTARLKAAGASSAARHFHVEAAGAVKVEGDVVCRGAEASGHAGIHVKVETL